MSSVTPILWQTALVDWAIQWSMWGISYALKSEKFYDFTGSCTFITLTALSIYQSSQSRHSPPNTRQIATALMVVGWATRLGLYLLRRVFMVGEDKRFRDVIPKAGLFWVYWTVQGLWIYLCLLPTFLLHVNNGGQDELTVWDYTGWAVWGVGFLIEVVADYQKNVFKSNPANKDKWIETGLWSLSRHPNYFGEIMLWFGVYLSSMSGLTQTQALVAAISPLWVAYQLRYLSGVPLLEKPYDKKYKNVAAYQAYKKRVPILVPFWH